MRRRGILVLDVLPAEAAAAVVERYHQLKRRGVPLAQFRVVGRGSDITKRNAECLDRFGVELAPGYSPSSSMASSGCRGSR
jgi:hypothetical protein